ncbi:MAG TPA: DEAD/DEAH box helicase [Streptosporangiaceae bacterium]|jgi:SNF2 family DNA or RNA helicase
MYVAHGAWHDGTLHLWAEDPAAYDTSRGRAVPRPHPYAVAAPDLPRVLAPLSELTGKGDAAELGVRLPGSTARPAPSPDLVVAGRAARGAPRLLPWRVPTLAFDPARARDVLAALTPGGPGDAPAREPRRAAAEGGGGRAGVLAGAELQYLAVVAEEAADLVRRGRMLPSLRRAAEGDEARWRCVLTGADAERARALAAAMPPVLRAVDGEPGSGDLIVAMLDAFADASVRARVTGPLAAGGRASGRYADRWARALTGADARVRAVPGADAQAAFAPSTAGEARDAAEVRDAAEARDADELAEALEAWRGAAHAGDGPVRTFFRLVEPEFTTEPADDDADPAEALPEAPWEVAIGLQATDDPSLVIPAEAVWRADPEELGAIMTARPEETLLAGLGRAARLYDDLDEALRTATPSRVATDAAGAYRFLKEAAPLLAAAGFGVQLPRWAGAAKLGRRLTATTKSTTQQATVEQGFGRDEIVRFQWDLALGDTTIDADELLRLAALKVPLVRLRGQWVELDDRQLTAALEFLKHRRDGEMTTGDALAITLLDDEDDPLPLTGVTADGPLGDLLSGEADQRLTPVATPAGLTGELRPYQRRGLAWLTFMSDLGLGTILADDMGLGKTVQTLGLVQADTDRGGAGATLLVCPMSLVGNWQREAERFTPGLRVYVHHGGQRAHGEELAAAVSGADLVVTTYGTVARDQEELAGFSWRRVVVDEAQAIKNARTRQARAVRALPAGHRLALTGTPVENHLTELWSIMEFANPGLLGPAEGFRRRFAKPIEADGDEDAAGRLRRATGPFVLRRLKTDKSIITDLPEKQEIKVWCNLTPEQASLYQATVDDMMARLEHSEGIEYRGLVLATMAKLKQVCNHPAHFLKDGSRLAGRSGKLARLDEIVDEIMEDGDKALCFTQYAEFGAALRPYLAARTGRPVLFLHGGLGKAQRDDLVAGFAETDEPAIFLLSLKAGGTGLNLTAASHVIHFDRWWNPAVEDQATDRAFRIGQRKNVQVRKFVCVGTLEERIDEMIERKKRLAERIVGTGEDWLTSLSTGELRDVIRLAPEAVSS